MYSGEKLNSISHLAGAILALMALGALLAVSIPTGDAKVIVGFTSFGLAMVLLYTMSTVYHSVQTPKVKKIFKVLDHIAIYLLIAGTYTPLMLISMPQESGIPILALVWSLAVLGIASELLLSGRVVKTCQLIIYLAMGWACSLDIGALSAALTPAGTWWLAAGGVVYTAGIFFYILDKASLLSHAHGIWHFFVLAGSACHFVTVIGYVH